MWFETLKVAVCVLFQFVDLWILLGCDYCEKIVGLGPTRALKLIQLHRTIEDVIKNVNRRVCDVDHLFPWNCRDSTAFATPPGAHISKTS